MAMNYNQGTGSIIFPRKKPFTEKNIRAFLESYKKGELEESFMGVREVENPYTELMPSVVHLGKPITLCLD